MPKNLVLYAVLLWGFNIVSKESVQNNGMNLLERRSAYGLAGIYGFRMLGLFLILPVFALYAEDLEGATPVLVGLAIGVYGLTQAVLQIPFGLISDRVGRKPVIVVGLLLFALGSVIAATADDIWVIIMGRAIQGSGAIAAAIMALLADLTRESQRTKAMALVGITIGMSFSAALILAPLMQHWIGMSGIFWLTAGLAVMGILILLLVVPTPAQSSVHGDAEPVPAMFRRVLVNFDLLRLDLGIFILHLVLTGLFLSIPLVLRDAGLPVQQHSYLYLPVMLLAMAIMVPFIIMAEKHGRMKSVFLGAIGLLVLAQLGFYFTLHSFWGLAFFMLLFFIAFNVLEATLPSLVSKTAPAEAKGTAMGVYSTSQFSGAFFGGLVGGWIHAEFGLSAVFLMGVLACLCWLLIASGMQVKKSADAISPVDG